MRVEVAIRSLHALPDSWVRVESICKAPGGLELRFSVHKESGGGRKLDILNVICRGVCEAQITDFDGGGLALYPSSHAAARQYTAQRAELRWLATLDSTSTLGTLYEAHSNAVQDWIPFDRFVSLKAISDKKCACRGPSFLMQAYARALRAAGENPQLIVRRSANSKRPRLRVLHFGDSLVVAARFSVASRTKAL